MSGHTPGPWTAVENGFAFDVNAENETVAFVPSGDDAARANAALISAAPELLALACEVAAGCGGCNGTGKLEWDIRVKGKVVAEAGDDCEDCADIRALIALATKEHA